MNCQSCGLPMMIDVDHGGGRIDNPYCRYCTDESGNLKSKEEIREGMINLYMQSFGKPREEAEKEVDARMSEMPAWASAAAPAPVSIPEPITVPEPVSVPAPMSVPEPVSVSEPVTPVTAPTPVSMPAAYSEPNPVPAAPEPEPTPANPVNQVNPVIPTEDSNKDKTPGY